MSSRATGRFGRIPVPIDALGTRTQVSPYVDQWLRRRRTFDPGRVRSASDKSPFSRCRSGAEFPAEFRHLGGGMSRRDGTFGAAVARIGPASLAGRNRGAVFADYPDRGGFTAYSARLAPNSVESLPDEDVRSMVWRAIPCGGDQGKISGVQGTRAAGSGNFSRRPGNARVSGVSGCRSVRDGAFRARGRASGAMAQTPAERPGGYGCRAEQGQRDRSVTGNEYREASGLALRRVRASRRPVHPGAPGGAEVRSEVVRAQARSFFDESGRFSPRRSGSAA